MAHEIEQHDGLMLASGQPAWHGLGTLIEGTATPEEALALAAMDWPVEKWPIMAHQFGDQPTAIKVPRLYATVRTDVNHVLGVIGEDYTPIQNATLAEFCSLLAEGDDSVRIETAGSIYNGAKVWFLIRGESFSVRAKARAEDELKQYICVSNGHDGRTALRCTPTMIRAVCKNTLSGIIPMNDSADQGPIRHRQKLGHFIARHVGDIKQKVEDAKAALGLYRDSMAYTRECVTHLAARDMSGEELRRFWLALYAKAVEPIPVDPATEEAERAARKAADAMQWIDAKFQEESAVFGPSLWLGMNAFTDWAQHAAGRRLRDPVAAHQHRVNSALFGTAAERTNEALSFALAW